MIELVFFRDGKSLLRQQIDENNISIGRATDNHVQLTDEDISRHHCHIKWQEGGYVLTDQSSNGTFLNNKPVTSSPLKAGDTISIGQWTIRVTTPSHSAENTVNAPHRPTSVLRFDAQNKTLSTERLQVTVFTPEQKPYSLTTSHSEIIVGSMETCDVVIRDPYVSRRHCKLTYHQGRALLLDLGSTNGTYVENIRVDKVSIPAQGAFQVGKTVIKYASERSAETIKPAEGTSLGPLVGQSRAMREIFSLIEKVAPSDATILITGESGTGKEMVARLLHQMSHRTDKPFVSINCGAIPASIIESQLFGHEKGAFTGAIERTTGLFELAQDGTLFLDEIGEMPLELQTRLLQVLENHKVRRLGGSTEINVNFRLIAATNKDLKRLTSEHRFRQDLFYRLFVVPINLPPLRERGDDIPLLADHFISQFSPSDIPRRLTEAAISKLNAHSWPGNVRELKNVIQRSIILTGDINIDTSDLSFAPVNIDDVVEHNLETMERETIVAALKENKGNQTKTAKQLGIARTTLSTKIAKYEIDLEKL